MADPMIEKDGSEAGSGNEANPALGESGQAEGVGYAERAFGDVQPDPDRPRSRADQPRTTGGIGQDTTAPGSPAQQERARREEDET